MFSRKQRIILIAAGSVAILLLIGLIALIRSEQLAAELHSTPSPSAIPLPTARITLRPTDIPTPDADTDLSAAACTFHGRNADRRTVRRRPERFPGSVRSASK
ncbi:MAG: hypothetical protein Q4A88_01055 [Clostridia bacterium]|nr:hypothetical protein [Clostridia bacterium]